MPKAVLFFILLLGWSAHAKFSGAGCETFLIHSGSLGSSYVDLQEREKHVHQMDVRLKDRDLLVENGGLCASTCAINILRAASLYSTGRGGLLDLFSTDYIENLVKGVWIRTGADARYGLSLPAAGEAMLKIASQEGLLLYAEWIPLRNRTSDISVLKPADNEILMVAIDSGAGDDGTRKYHALVITGADLQAGLVSVSNPHHPNRIDVLPVIWTPFNIPSLKIDYPSAKNSDLVGTVVDILRVTVPRLRLPPP